MFIRLLFLFTLVPLLELMLLIEVGRKIGTLNTIAIVVLTGIVGAALARAQGFSIITRIQSELHQGKLPGESLLDGALVLAGAVLLLTPGLITDTMGLCLLLPVTRSLVKKYLKSYLRSKIQTGEFQADYTIEE